LGNQNYIIYDSTLNQNVLTLSGDQNQFLDLGFYNFGTSISFTFAAKWTALNSWSRILECAGDGVAGYNSIVIANHDNTNNFVFEYWLGG